MSPPVDSLARIIFIWFELRTPSTTTPSIDPGILAPCYWHNLFTLVTSVYSTIWYSFITTFMVSVVFLCHCPFITTVLVKWCLSVTLRKKVLDQTQLVGGSWLRDPWIGSQPNFSWVRSTNESFGWDSMKLSHESRSMHSLVFVFILWCFMNRFPLKFHELFF